MQLIAQSVDERILVKLTVIDNRCTQRPPRRSLCGQAAIQLLFRNKPALDEDIAELAPVEGEQFFPREAVRGLIPADPLVGPYVFQIT